MDIFGFFSKLSADTNQTILWKQP